MLQVRQCMFETNSSASHHLIIMTDSTYSKWEDGELFLDSWYSGNFTTKEEAIEKITQRIEENGLDRYDMTEEEFDKLKKGTLDSERFGKIVYDILYCYSYDKAMEDEEAEILEESLDGVTAISYYSWC